MHFAVRRLPVFLLAFLPVVWGNCPYWFVGVPCAGTSASKEAEPRCPCCKKKAPPKSAPAPTSPFDCGDCPMLVARNGSAPAPAPVGVPTADDGGVAIAPIAVLAALDLELAVTCARGETGPPAGPPGGVVSVLLDEVALRI